MKDIIIFSTFLIALTSCGTRKSQTHSTNVNQSTAVIPQAPEIMKGNMSVLVRLPDKTDSTESTLTYQFYSDNDKIYKNTVNKYIDEFLWNNTIFDQEYTKYRRLTHSVFQSSLYKFEAQANEEIKSSDYPTMWQLNAVTEITENMENYVQLHLSTYIFTGGAHGNGYDLYHLIDKNSGQKVTFIELVNNPDEFNKIAEVYFREVAELPNSETAEGDLDDLGFWFEDNKFSCNDNFFMDSKGITFTFNTYEVAPYSFGTFTFRIPLSKIKHLLNIELDFKN
jgi:hypothetical protein